MVVGEVGEPNISLPRAPSLLFLSSPLSGIISSLYKNGLDVIVS